MDKAFFCFVLFLCVALNTDVVCNNHETRKSGGLEIVGGYNITIQEAPYQIYLTGKYGPLLFACGGCILSPQYVITAAHCLIGNVTDISIRAGSTYRLSGGTLYMASSYTAHPKFDPGTHDYDVGLIKLQHSINIDGINTKAVKLPEENTAVAPGTALMVSGWGTTSEGGFESDSLLAVKVPAISTLECAKDYESKYDITPRMVCAGLSKGGKDACQGDSGGPTVVVESGVLVGLVSFGIGCVEAKYPGVYTNVSSVLDFIKQQTGI